MKIAITSRDSEISSEVDPRFGRAACFLIYDLEDDSFEFIENEQALNTPSGAGIQAARHVVDSQVKALLTGHCGPKAFKALQSAEIDIYTGVSGTLQEAIEAYRQGKWKAIDQADVEGHWV